jgi:hypothetical protein
MKAILVTLIVAALCACGGGDEDKCVTATDAGPIAGRDLIAPVKITGELQPPFVVTVTAKATATKDEAVRNFRIGFAGDAYEVRTLPIPNGTTMMVTLVHRFEGTETSYTPAYAYFGTLSVADHGDNRSYVHDVRVQACEAR